MKNITFDLFKKYNSDIFNLINHFTKSEKRTLEVMGNLQNYLENDSAIIGGHILDDQLVSFIWCYGREFGGELRLHISYFIVSDLYRGKGLSKDLIAFAKEKALQNEIYKIDLNVEPDNQRAIDMYHRAGFETEKLQLLINLNEVDKIV